MRLIDQHNAKMPGTLQRELKRRTPTDSAMSGRSRVGAGTLYEVCFFFFCLRLMRFADRK